MMQNNYRYSVALLDHCQEQRRAVPLRVERVGLRRRHACSAKAREHESPLNVYGYSKFLFDQYVRRLLPERTAQIAGFRYFNVYGPREAHKGRMAVGRVPLLRPVPRATGKVRLFEGSGGYAAGEQRRDFVSVDDVVAVNLAVPRPPASAAGIFNVGTGSAPTFNERRGGDDQRVSRRGGQAGADARRHAARRRDRIRAVPAGARGQATRASPRPTCRGCAPPATRRRCRASATACAAMSNG